MRGRVERTQTPQAALVAQACKAHRPAAAVEESRLQMLPVLVAAQRVVRSRETSVHRLAVPLVEAPDKPARLELPEDLLEAELEAVRLPRLRQVQEATAVRMAVAVVAAAHR